MEKKFILLTIFCMFILAITPHNTATYLNNQEGEIEIGEITGGFGRIKVEILNNGNEELNNVDWNISITGGLFSAINSYTENTILTISPNSSEEIKRIRREISKYRWTNFIRFDNSTGRIY